MKTSKLISIVLSIIALFTACTPENASDIADSITESIAAETTDTSQEITENKTVRSSIEMNSYNKELTTAKCTESSNAADFTSLLVEAEKGDCIVFENVEFTNAKCLMLEAAISEGYSKKAIELYIDEISTSNKIGTLITGKEKKNDLEFNEQYAILDKSVTGGHSLIFNFTEPVSFEADWFKLTSYTGEQTEEERDARMKWWRDVKFGQFIHFGAYSYLGGEYLGEQVGWYSEWIMSSKKISKEDYAQNVAANFNPKDFDAKKIVSDAKAAGQKYIVITSRHHEGLSIFDTRVRNFRDYSLLNKENCPQYNGGDILKELADECRKEGVHFGVYTTIMDWHDPTQTGLKNTIAEGHTKEEYKAQLKGQLKELIEIYGAEVFFFDGEWVNWWTQTDGREIYRYILSLNDKCIVNNRVGKRNPSDGDYGTPEQQIPASGLDYDWESNVTMNDSFGYKKNDTNWKSTQWIIKNVMDVVSKGGNMLLNVGPDGNGVVEATPLANMAKAGKWFEKFGEAVYGTQKTCFSKSLGKVKITVNNEKSKIYVTLLEDDPKEIGTILLPAIENKVIGVTEMANENNVPFEVFDSGILLHITDTVKQDYATVYEIAVEGEPKEKPSISIQKNIAEGASVTTSSFHEGKDGDKITDGNTAAVNENRWAPHDSDNSPWAIVDLGKEKDIVEVVIREWLDTFYTQDYRTESFKLAISSDNESWTEVYAGGSIGEEFTITLSENIRGRYIKLYDISQVANAKGTPSFHELEVYETRALNPQITFSDAPESIDALPLTIKGTYSDGSKVTVKVWGASFAAFDVEAELNEKDASWQAFISKSDISKGSISLTAVLSDENENQLAVSVCNVEYK